MFFGFLKIFKQIDFGDPRADSNEELISLIYRSFLCFRSSSPFFLEFKDLVGHFNFELVCCCQFVFEQVAQTHRLQLNNACYWLAALHALIRESMIEIEPLLQQSPIFRMKLFSMIEENNRIFLNFFIDSYAAVVPINKEEIALKIEQTERYRILNFQTRNYQETVL